MFHRATTPMILISAMFCIGLAGSAAAQQKIGVIDIEKVTRESKSIQQTVAKVEADLKAREQELERMINAFQLAQTQLEGERGILKTETLGEREDELEKQRMTINDMQYEINKRVKQLQREIMEPEVARIFAAVNKIGAEEGYDIILRKESIAFVNPAHELTERVIRELDKAIKPAEVVD
jgi:outer membrane protein